MLFVWRGHLWTSISAGWASHLCSHMAVTAVTGTFWLSWGEDGARTDVAQTDSRVPAWPVGAA